MLVYGLWFLFLTAVGFSLLGIFASRLSNWFRNRPKVILSFNFGAGLTFIASGVAVAALKQR